MVIHRDRWPAVLTREQEDILMRAGFLYDSDLGVLVNPTLRKVPAVEAAAERGLASFDPSRAGGTRGERRSYSMVKPLATSAIP